MTFLLHILPQWLELAALALFMGAVSSRLWICPGDAGAGGPCQETVLRRLRLMLGSGAAVMLPCYIAVLFVRTADMSGDPVLSVVPILPAVVLKTHFGRTWMIGAASIVLMLLFTAAGAGRGNARTIWFFLFVLGAIVGMTQSASGHAADAGDFSIAAMADWLHLMAAMVWIGGLFALAFALLPRDFAGGAETEAFADAAVRFSSMAGPAACIVAATSVYNAWLEIGGVAPLLNTGYGRTATAKIILFVLVLLIALFNRGIAIPWLRSKAGRPEVPDGKFFRLTASVRLRLVQALDRDRRLFTRALKAEAFLMLALLLCAVMMRHEVPAKHAAHLDTSGGHVHEHKSP